MTLKILMPIYNQVGKGTYWRTYGFAQELATRGHKVTLLSAGSGDQAHTEVNQNENLCQITFPSLFNGTRGSGYDPGDIFGRIKWLRQNQERFDLVHAFESRPASLLPALTGKRRGACVVSDWCDWFGRGGSVEQRQNPVARALLRPVETALENRSRPKADGVTVINQTLYQKALSLDISAERILLLPNGAYTDMFQMANRLAARKRLGLPPDIPLIAYTGTLFNSDAELMAEAFNIIQEEVPGARLLMIGYTNLDLRSLVQHPEAVISTGPVSFHDLVAYVAASTIGWIPLADNLANAGRFPLKLNDFMASGRAVLVTDVGDLGNTVRQYGLGLVARPDPISISLQALELLADTVRREAIEHRARDVAETVFAWPKVVNELEAFYYTLLNSS